jgi:putative hemolysin
MHDSTPTRNSPLAQDARYVVQLAVTVSEIESALRLRHEVFIREMGSGEATPDGRESDHHDRTCEHLIVIDRLAGGTIGTYRMKAMEAAGGIDGFYSSSEFKFESLPNEVLANGIEIGRACIAAGHRNTRAIFLLWRALARRMRDTGKRYFFGCCSIFTRDSSDGESAYSQLEKGGFIHREFRVEPRRPVYSPRNVDNPARIKLPGLFEMYLRIGARVCGRPAYDEEFGTMDFFVVFDLEAMEPKYRRLFLD